MLNEGVQPMVPPQNAMACYPSPLIIGDCRVWVVRRITVPQRKARLWTRRTFHVKPWISLVHVGFCRRPRRRPTARRDPLTSDTVRTHDTVIPSGGDIGHERQRRLHACRP